MFERIRRFIPTTVLSLAVFSVQVYPGCIGIVWHVLELMIDAFILLCDIHQCLKQLIFLFASLADKILGLYILIKDIAPVYTVICSDGFLFWNWICTALSYRSCLLALPPAFSIPVTKNIGVDKALK